MRAFLLVDAVPDARAEVTTWLGSLREVTRLHTVEYGHFTLLAELECPSHLAVQTFIANRVRYHKGIEQVREVDEAEVPAILASEERGSRRGTFFVA